MTSPYQVEPGFGIGFSQGTANGEQHGENLILPEIKMIFLDEIHKSAGRGCSVTAKTTTPES
jgi:hypothetical protein